MKATKTLVGILVLTLAMMTTAWAASPADFTDIPNDWSTASIERAIENDWMVGAYGLFRPDDQLTRAEMATVINRLFGATAQADISNYVDVDASDWYATEMAIAVKMGTFQGDGNYLNPDDNITREEVFAVLARAYVLEDDAELPASVTDANQVSSWAVPTTAAMINAGYVDGYTDGTIRPQNNITRAEFAKLLDNMIGEVITEAGSYNTLPDGNILVTAPGVVLEDVVINGNLILADGIGAEDVVLNNVTVNGNIVVRGGANLSLTGTTSAEGVQLGVQSDANFKLTVEETANAGEVNIVNSNAPITVSGLDKENTLVVSGDGVEVTVADSNIDALNVTGDNNTVTVEQGSTVDTVTVTGDNNTVAGKGKVGNIAANGAKGTKVSTSNTKITADETSDGVTVGDDKVEAGSEGTTNATGTGLVGGSTIGGGSSLGGGTTGGNRVEGIKVTFDSTSATFSGSTSIGQITDSKFLAAGSWTEEQYYKRFNDMLSMVKVNGVAVNTAEGWKVMQDVLGVPAVETYDDPRVLIEALNQSTKIDVTPIKDCEGFSVDEYDLKEVLTMVAEESQTPQALKVKEFVDLFGYPEIRIGEEVIVVSKR